MAATSDQNEAATEATANSAECRRIASLFWQGLEPVERWRTFYAWIDPPGP